MIEHTWQLVLEHKAVLAGASIGVSVILIVLSIVLMPWFIARLPADYFCRILSDKRPGRLSPARMLVRVGKNIAGVILVLVGLAMLVLPGQGVITLMVALTLLDFPGKRRVERWLIERPQIRRGLDWLRRRTGKPPFVWEHLD